MRSYGMTRVNTGDGIYWSRTRAGGGIFSGSALYGLGVLGEEEEAPRGGYTVPTQFYQQPTAPQETKPSGATPTASNVSYHQGLLNTALRAEGYNTISVDGKIGKGTCGAIAWFRKLPTASKYEFSRALPNFDYASPCAEKQPWTWPTKAGAAVPTGPIGPPPPVTPVTPYAPVEAGMTTGQKLAIAGGAVAAAGILWFMRKRKAA